MDIVIWIIALSLYALFWLWYCGVKGRLSKHEVEIFISSFEAKGLSESALLNIREFLEQDDGREFFMVNLLEIKSPKRESQKLLMGYFKKFMSGMIPRGGHPLFLAKAVSNQVICFIFRLKYVTTNTPSTFSVAPANRRVRHTFVPLARPGYWHGYNLN